jgi:hypothetical protein
MAEALIQPKWSFPDKQRFEQTGGITLDAVQIPDSHTMLFSALSQAEE